MRTASALIVTLVTLSGCGSSGSSGSYLNVRQTQKAVANEFLRRNRAPARVLCPSTIPRRGGYSFTCTASLAVGTAIVSVTENHGSEGLTYTSKHPLVLLKMPRVADAITDSIALRRHLAATVTCPAFVLQQEGLAFTCTASVKGQSRIYPFSVTEADRNGDVRLIGG